MNEIKNYLEKLINEGKDVLTTKYNPYSFENPICPFPKEVNEFKFSKWRIKTLKYLNEILLNEDIRLKAFDEEIRENTYSNTVRGISILKSIVEELDEGTFKLKNTFETKINHIKILESIFDNFHRIAKQLEDRRENRETLEINDEYDVQDLLHSLLHIPFKDIRPEEWTPTYGGKSTRMDFLIKDENIVIETKMTRENLKDKKIIEELIIDTTHYSNHPNCNTLYCFVYDKKELIKNPQAIENDLSGQKDGLEVKVKIQPKR